MEKYVTLKIPAEDWKMARWVINCFLSCIEDCYEVGSIRRVEADKLAEDFHEHARKQVNSWEENDDYYPSRYDT